VRTADLIQEYAETNPYWARDHNYLDHFRQIRNLLIHEQSDTHGYPIMVTVRSPREAGGDQRGARKPHPQQVQEAGDDDPAERLAR
jgi:hypothetical protein